MKATDFPLIQIAGVRDADEMRLLMDAGVHWLGFPLRLTVNKEDLSEADAAVLIRNLPLGFHGVVITYLNRADDVVSFCEQLGARVIQLHGDIPVDELREIKRRDPGLSVFKSLVVRAGNEEALRQLVEETAPFVDAYITDTFNPATGQEGATGLVHDWNISRRLVEFSPRPILLAGGLHAGNVAEAILAVHPAGVDSHTGVEGPDGRKSKEKVEKFVQESLRAFRIIR